MSGVICEIIIRGNRTQAIAQSLCTLAAGYENEDLMTDEQKQRATELMGTFNQAGDHLLKQILGNTPE